MPKNMDYVYLGNCPTDEQCAQMGRDGFALANRLECQALIAQIKRTDPDIPKTVQFKIITERHDFGSYRTVIVEFPIDDEDAEMWAYRIEGDLMPDKWDDAALEWIYERMPNYDEVVG